MITPKSPQMSRRQLLKAAAIMGAVAALASCAPPAAARARIQHT